MKSNRWLVICLVLILFSCHKENIKTDAKSENKIEAKVETKAQTQTEDFSTLGFIPKKPEDFLPESAGGKLPSICDKMKKMRFPKAGDILECANDNTLDNVEWRKFIYYEYFRGKIYECTYPSEGYAKYIFDEEKVCEYYGKKYDLKKPDRCLKYDDIINDRVKDDFPDFIAADLPLYDHSSWGAIYRAEKSGQLSPEALAVYKSLETLPASSDDSTRDGLCEFYFKDDPDELNYFFLHGRYQYPMRK